MAEQMMQGMTETQETRLADYLPPAFLIDQVDLIFNLSPEATIVRSTLSMRRNPAHPDQSAAIHLDGEALELRSILLDGEPLATQRYEVGPHGLTIHDAPDELTLDIETLINPAQNSELSGLYVSGGDFFTQCEAEGFRRMTYFPDRPDVMARFTATLIADAMRYPVLLSNGNPIDKGMAEGGLHWAKWEDPHPKPSYLFALVAGDLVSIHDHFVTSSGRHVDLGIYVRAGDQDKCDHAMLALKKSMKWDEEVFGLEYDLDIFNIAAVSDFNAGAMENKGLNIFNTAYVLAKPDTATDADYENIERVIAHEYFHNWTGDRVTCRDWFQLSLKEGLTVFRDQEYGADQGSPGLKRIADVRRLRAGQFQEDASPLAHPVRPATYQKIDNFYTATIYEKGAEVVRMIRTIIGREKFRAGMDIYIARNDNSAATIEDFIAAMHEASGFDFTPFMLWYSQAGTPEITSDEIYDPATKTLTLTLSQRTKPTPGQPVKLPLLIPVNLGLLAEDGQEMHSETILLTQSTQSFTFTDMKSKPVVSLFRQFSAPVRLLNQDPARLAFLASHDTDQFNRWEAGQEYATLVLLKAIAAHQRGEPFILDAGLLAAMTAALANTASDPAFAAEIVILPAESILAGRMDMVDPDAIHNVRQAAKRAIGTALTDQFAHTYHAFDDHGPYKTDSGSIGKRALKYAALSYLMACEAPGAINLATTQINAARNMTDVLAALSLLAATETPQRDAALQNFHDKWKHDPLVLDKWFSIQARSSAADTLDRVRNLTTHGDFDMRNPNRLRALVGAFAYGNQAQFHKASGEGYQFLSDMIIKADPINRAIAARFVAPLGDHQKLDPTRQGLMKQYLTQILQTPCLSANVREMVSKSLG